MIIEQEEWQNFLAEQRDYSLLQTPEWGEVKSAFGWSPAYIRSETAGAMVLFKHLPLGRSIAYIPRGPVGQDFASLWPEADRLCKAHKAVFLRVEPDFWQGTPENKALLSAMENFRPAFATVQPPRTILIDLNASEDEILSRMNQKTRYNIRLSQKKGLELNENGDASTFHKLMTQTGERDAFGVHSEAYYKRVLEIFRKKGSVYMLTASYQGEPLAGLMLFIVGKRGYYLYGASSNAERSRMPNHFLQWHAIRLCKEAGCNAYDLWGIPDEDESVLETQFLERQDGLWPVYRFKRGFGGTILRTAGSFDRVYNKPLYELLRIYDRERRKK